MLVYVKKKNKYFYSNSKKEEDGGEGMSEECRLLMEPLIRGVKCFRNMADLPSFG